jgi:hypothetical protein
VPTRSFFVVKDAPGWVRRNPSVSGRWKKHERVGARTGQWDRK